MATTDSKAANVVKMKPSISNLAGSSKGKIESSVKVKKIESSSKKQQQQPVVDAKNKSVSAVTKTEVKSKTPTSSSKTPPSSSKTTKTTTKTARVREKKVYTLAGQRYDPPEEREPLRIFYESLSKQIPSSEMAEFWMMEHGLLSPERAKKAYDKKLKRQKMQRMGTPIKSTKPSSSKPESSQKQQLASKNGELKAKKRIVNYSEDNDVVLSPKRRKGKEHCPRT